MWCSLYFSYDFLLNFILEYIFHLKFMISIHFYLGDVHLHLKDFYMGLTCVCLFDLLSWLSFVNITKLFLALLFTQLKWVFLVSIFSLLVHHFDHPFKFYLKSCMMDWNVRFSCSGVCGRGHQTMDSLRAWCANSVCSSCDNCPRAVSISNCVSPYQEGLSMWQS